MKLNHNGNTWTLATSDTGWSNRSYADVVVLNNGICLIAGEYEGVDRNNVWHSSQ